MSKNYTEKCKKRRALDIEKPSFLVETQDQLTGSTKEISTEELSEIMNNSEILSRLELTITSKLSSLEQSQALILKSLEEVKQLLSPPQNEISETLEKIVPDNGSVLKTKTGKVKAEGPNKGKYFQTTEKDGELVKGSFKFVFIKPVLKSGVSKDGRAYSVETTANGDHISGTYVYL